MTEPSADGRAGILARPAKLDALTPGSRATAILRSAGRRA